MINPPKHLHSLVAYSSDYPLFQTLVEAGVATALEIAPDGKILDLPKTFFRLVGLPEETPMPLQLQEILADGGWDELEPLVTRVYRTAEPQVRSIRFDLSPIQGTTRTFWALIGHPYPWANKTSATSTNKRAMGLHFFLFPHEEAAKLDLDWLHAHRLTTLGALTTGVAHDLNNLFTSALTFNQMLQEKATSSYEKSHLHLIEKTLFKATHLANGLLDFAKNEEQAAYPVDPIPCLRDLTQMIDRVTPKEVNLELSLPTRSYPIIIRPRELCQVILNLLVNARDAIEGDGTIQVEASYFPPRNPEKLVMTITDNGTGIQPADEDRIFDPFFTTKKPGDGTGLGLSIVKKIIEDYHGEIIATSYPGEHTRFTITFPIAPNMPR